ncbi:MAG: hypothetical protein JNK82_17430 [Myxococcaceae bacterium]|nr:hypothetical protein [Myxococcaceae bacterium]
MTAQEAEALPEPKLAEVLAAAVKAKDASLPEALAQSQNKAVARAAKKALYQLKSSGVAVAAPAAPKGEQPKISREVEALPALLSAISGAGERAVFIAKPRAQGPGLETYQAVVHDEAGLVHLERGESTRGKYRRHLEELKKGEPPVLYVPLERALEELGVAWGVSLRTKSPMPQGAEQALNRLGVALVDAWPAIAREPKEPALEARGASLHDEREIQGWVPGEDHLKLLALRLDEVAASPLQLSEAQKREQRMQKAALTAAELTAEERKIYAHRLWRMAELFEASGREEKGHIARAEARLLANEPKAPSRFLERLFEKVVRIAEQSAPPPEGAPLEAPAPKTSPGGLIVP